MMSLINKSTSKRKAKASSSGSVSGAHTQKKSKAEVKDNISSAEEEESLVVTKTRTKRVKKGRPPVEMKQGDLTVGAPRFTVKIEGLPKIVDISQITIDHPHIKIEDKTCVSAKENAMDLSVDKDTDSKTKKKKERDSKKSEGRILSDQASSSANENPLAVVAQQQALQRQLDSLPVVKLIMLGQEAWAQKDKMEMLQREMLHLPGMDADYEQKEMMRPAGEWTHANGRKYKFPACEKGAKCVGVIGKVKMDDGKSVFCHPLVSMMFPPEYAHFIETGIAPSARTLCVGCWRRGVLDTVLAQRGSQVLVDGDEQEFKLDTEELIQPYRQTTDQKGGYYDNCVIKSPESKWEGLIGPMAVWRATYLVGRIDKHGRPYIDQTALMWKPGDVDMIDMGETARNFWTGVAH
jgi:hypothetical protein